MKDAGDVVSERAVRRARARRRDSQKNGAAAGANESIRGENVGRRDTGQLAGRHVFSSWISSLGRCHYRHRCRLRPVFLAILVCFRLIGLAAASVLLALWRLVHPLPSVLVVSRLCNQARLYRRRRLVIILLPSMMTQTPAHHCRYH